MKRAFNVKGIKNLDKTEMKNTKGSACGASGPGIDITCTDSFTIVYKRVERAVYVDIIGHHFTVQ